MHLLIRTLGLFLCLTFISKNAGAQTVAPTIEQLLNINHEGNSWTYRGAVGGMGAVTTTVTVRRTTLVAGRVAMAMSGFLPGQPEQFVRTDLDGNAYAYFAPTGGWATIMQLPLETGHRWYNGVSHYMRWGGPCSFQLPNYPIFEGCWERIQELPSGNISDIYCPNVGMVSSRNLDLTSTSPWYFSLTSYSNGTN